MQFFKWFFIILGTSMTYNAAMDWQTHYMETGHWFWTKQAFKYFCVFFVMNIVMFLQTDKSRNARDNRALAGNIGNFPYLSIPIGFLSTAIGLAYTGYSVMLLIKKDFISCFNLLIALRFFSFYYGFLYRRTLVSEKDIEEIMNKRAKKEMEDRVKAALEAEQATAVVKQTAEAKSEPALSFESHATTQAASQVVQKTQSEPMPRPDPPPPPPAPSNNKYNDNLNENLSGHKWTDS